MRRPRLQFRLSTLLWITLAVVCWFGGTRFERWWFHDRVVYRSELKRRGGNNSLPRSATLTKYADGRKVITAPDDNGGQIVLGESYPDAEADQ
jgi:hypothetical protein